MLFYTNTNKNQKTDFKVLKISSWVRRSQVTFVTQVKKIIHTVPQIILKSMFNFTAKTRRKLALQKYAAVFSERCSRWNLCGTSLLSTHGLKENYHQIVFVCVSVAVVFLLPRLSSILAVFICETAAAAQSAYVAITKPAKWYNDYFKSERTNERFVLYDIALLFRYSKLYR